MRFILKKIRKAVFPVAGLGTRFLPVTKAMPKELLPILSKPIIQYAVEEAINAGIETLIFVTGRNKRAIEDHFDSNIELESFLKSKGKDKEATMIHDILPPEINCVFVRQPEQLGLGHAILCAESVVGSEPFAVLLADDFIIGKDNNTKRLINSFYENPSTYLCVMPVEREKISDYGIVELLNKGPKVSKLVEKPLADFAPSNIASIGRYILEPSIFGILRNLKAGFNNEIQLADALHQLCLDGKVSSTKLEGQRFDCGSKTGYLEAILESIRQDPEYAKLIK